MSKDPLVRRSKHLSLVLRHEPGSVGLTLDAAGWAVVAELLPAMKLTTDQLEEVVGKNDKKRFEFNADKTKIRACQGHSLKVELGYFPAIPWDVLFHGTTYEAYKIIAIEGLKKMDRHHVHLSIDVETALKVARRRPGPLVLRVDAKRMTEDGLVFYLSSNGVWLTDAVAPTYLSVETSH